MFLEKTINTEHVSVSAKVFLFGLSEPQYHVMVRERVAAVNDVTRNFCVHVKMTEPLRVRS